MEKKMEHEMETGCTDSTSSLLRLWIAIGICIILTFSAPKRPVATCRLQKPLQVVGAA